MAFSILSVLEWEVSLNGVLKLVHLEVAMSVDVS